MKKIFKNALVLAICLMMSFFLIGCKKKSDEQTLSRVTVDINPSIELIVDDENKVVSVTALNDDGNIIIVGESIVGKTAEEAVSLIVSVATDTGYLVKGEVSSEENQIKISVSGNEKFQEELYNSIKTEVEKVISTEHIKATVKKQNALVKDQLVELAFELDPTLSKENLNEMSEEQLLEVIKKARLETAYLYSEALVEMYKEHKAFEIQLVENEKTQEVINSFDASYQVYKEAYGKMLTSFGELINDAKQMYYDSLIDPSSDYQTYYSKLLDAKADLIAQKEKVAGLEEGVEKDVAMSILTLKEQTYNSLVKSTTYAYNMFKQLFEQLIMQLQNLEAQLQTYQDSLPSEIKTALNNKAADMESACNQVKNNFYAEFEREFADEIQYYKNLMQNKKDQLKAQ